MPVPRELEPGALPPITPAGHGPDRETLQAIFDHIPVMMSSYDAAGRLQWVNREWERVFGWTFDEALSVDILSELYPDAARRHEALEFIRTADERWRDFAPRTRHGLVVESAWSRFQLSDGSRVGVGIDVAERKRVAAALAEADAALERLRAIESITDGALRHLGLDDLLRELLARLQRALDTESATVLLLEDAKTLYPRAGHGYDLDPAVRVRVGAGVTGMVAATGEPLIVDNYSNVDTAGIQGIPEGNLRKIAAVMGVPLRIGDKVMGVVVVTSHRARRFTSEELQLLGLVADRVAPAVELARMVERVRGGRERQRVLARRLLTAQEEERRRLAMELHDQLGQVLTAVKINLGSLEKWAAAGSAPHHLHEAMASVDQAMQTVRDLALDLRPSVLDDFGLAAALRWYADRFARSGGVEMRVSIGALPALPPELETACFRVAQEALTNVARHARARHVELEVEVVAAGLEMIVRDDGIGFDVAAAREQAIAGGSMGLLSMQERVLLAGGELDIEAPSRGGTRVRARFALGEAGGAAR
jgi:PAS domain S-box-containing protein